MLSWKKVELVAPWQPSAVAQAPLTHGGVQVVGSLGGRRTAGRFRQGPAGRGHVTRRSACRQNRWRAAASGGRQGEGEEEPDRVVMLVHSFMRGIFAQKRALRLRSAFRSRSAPDGGVALPRPPLIRAARRTVAADWRPGGEDADLLLPRAQAPTSPGRSARGSAPSPGPTAVTVPVLRRPAGRGSPGPRELCARPVGQVLAGQGRREAGVCFASGLSSGPVSPARRTWRSAAPCAPRA